MLDFLPETREIRERDWTVAPVPADMQQRWVEITGPTDRKMTINALNSGADGFMADFEDANAPTWRNMVDGHINLRDAIDGTITYDGSDGRHYELGENPATLLVRPRGWHLPERHLLVDGEPVAGRVLRLRPVHVPLRAATAAQRLGAVLLPAEDGVPSRGAAVERRVQLRPGRARDRARHDQGDGADRDAAGGVRDGRDPVRAARPLGRAQRRALGLHLLGDQVLPRPSGDGAPRPRRGDDDGAVHARLHRAARRDLSPPRRPRDGRDGGADPVAQGRCGGQPKALDGVRADKEREVKQGYDGTWVAHPDLVPVAREVFEHGLDGAAEPARRASATTSRSPPSSCSTSRRPPARSPSRGCAPTSTSASSTSRSGSAVAAPPRSTT